MMNHDQALDYLNGVFDGIPNADELLQLVELEFIRKDAVRNSQNKVSIVAPHFVGLDLRFDPDIGPISTSYL